MSAFTDFSKEIARDFLHSVVFADDRIGLTPLPQSTEVVSLTRENVVKNDTNREPESTDRIIDVKPVIEEFLKQGIPCSFYTLKEASDPKIYIKSFRKADALILDWQIKSDDGEFILSILEGIFDKERNALKVVLLYTCSPKLVEIIEKVKAKFTDIPFDFDSEDKCSIKYGSFKVCAYAKTDISISPELKRRVKNDEPSLIEALLDDFTSMTAGIVSNTALNAVTVIRQNTHKLLGVFNKDLDKAFLAHRSMLLTPDDSENLLKDTIVSSIDSILSYSKISDSCNSNSINFWLDLNTLPDVDISIVKPINKVTINNTERKEWLKKGWKDFIKYILKKNEKDPLTDTQLENYDRNKDLLKDSNNCFIINGSTISEEFAILTHHKSNFILPAYQPILTLGVILQNCDKPDEYSLCVQQRCDSVRLKEGETRRFLFLSLEPTDNKFSVIFKNDANLYIKLKINNNNSHDLFTISFNQTHDGTVFAEKDETYFYFTDSDGKKYKWILDLKESHAQRISNKFAAQLCRIGLDESEWLRRSS